MATTRERINKYCEIEFVPSTNYKSEFKVWVCGEVDNIWPTWTEAKYDCDWWEDQMENFHENFDMAEIATEFGYGRENIEGRSDLGIEIVHHEWTDED